MKIFVISEKTSIFMIYYNIASFFYTLYIWLTFIGKFNDEQTPIFNEFIKITFIIS